ncbi:hypothetical protein SAY87_009988 [Trapa incisa]|uniref:Homeobox domain-containing protein n=2 Tax=Trapa TaxID=22665 RepID=A0AAN7RCL2_TRANT|nr:hypothetical protein SAY87_009988 [Trapa incisa]KAK4794118.1 hypothetical protein SAY86_012112 [Trapa natans]
MEDHGHDSNSSSGLSHERSTEPVRSRWTPKPEQILILESIFNSGMVNPTKDETVRIRKLLEKFGAVGDANVFYWFQNRRSRSRRRQRQMQAATALAGGGGGDPRNSNTHLQNHQSHHQLVSEAVNHSEGSSSTACAMGYALHSNHNYPQCPPTSYHVDGTSSTNLFGSSLGQDGGAENFFSVPDHVGFLESDQSSMFPSSLPYQSGYITVFINGIPTEVPRGPIDMKAVFGQNALLVHSSGLPLPINEFGFLMQSLDHGESYFLVSRST